MTEQRSIPFVHDKLRATIVELRTALADVTDDLEAELRNKYDGTLNYPSERRRYERDMEAVRRARKALSDAGHGHD